MSKLMISLFIAAGLSVAGTASAQVYTSKTTGTPMSKESYKMAKKNADAQYKIDKEACSPLSGNAKDVCVEEAKAALVKGKADAKVDRVAADTRQDAAEKQTDARKEASDDKRDANYKVAIEKCDAAAGAAKDACVSNAEAQFGKS